MNNIKSEIEISIRSRKKAFSNWLYRKRIKKLIREVEKHPLQFNCTAQEIRELNRK